MDRHTEGMRERHDLRLAAPDARVPDRIAVLRELTGRHQSVVERALAVLALDGGQEREEVIRMRVHVVGRCDAGGLVVRAGRRDLPEEGKLVRYSREQTVAIRVYLQRAGRKYPGKTTDVHNNRVVSQVPRASPIQADRILPLWPVPLQPSLALSAQPLPDHPGSEMLPGRLLSWPDFISTL